MKKIVLFLMLFFSSIICVNAASTEYFSVSDESSLESCLSRDSLCKLTDDVTITTAKNISSQVVLDLNGNTIKPDSSLTLTTGLFFVGRGGKLTIDDSKGNGKITTGNNVYAAIQMIDPGDTGDNKAELVVNDGTLEGYYYGITGNGNRHNTAITINGGRVTTINEDSVGIYQPQSGTLTINDGIIEGGTGIEVRAGNLKINNGTINATSPFTAVPNSSGSTTTGVGVTVAQHVNKNPINVDINNGNIKGQYAFYEWNPQENNQDSLDKIDISINGGDFKTTLEGGSAVYSEDFTGFIHGGDFNSDVSRYMAEDARTAAKIITDTTNKKGYGFIYTLVFIAAIIVGYILYKKYKIAR